MIQFDDLSLCNIGHINGNNATLEDGTRSDGNEYIFKNLSGKIKIPSLTIIYGTTNAFLKCLAFERNDYSGKISAEMNTISSYISENDYLIDYLMIGEIFDLMITLRRPFLSLEKKNLLIEIFGFSKIMQKLTKKCDLTEKRKITILLEIFSEVPILIIDDLININLNGRKEIVSILLKVRETFSITSILLMNGIKDSLLDIADNVILINSKGTHILYQGSRKALINHPSWIGTEEIEDDLTIDVPDDNIDDNYNISYRKYYPPLSKQIISLLKATFKKITIRNPMIFFRFLFKAIFFGVFTGLIYLDSSQYDPLIQIKNKTGILYFFSFSMFFSGTIISLPLIFIEKDIINHHVREQQLYKEGVYLVVKIITEFPFYFVFPFIEFLIAYYMIGLNSPFSIYLFSATFLGTVSVCGCGLGFLIGSSTDSLMVISLITPIILIPLFLLSGLYINIDSEPSWLSWIRYINPIYYAFAGLMQNEFTNNYFSNCDYEIYGDLCTGDIVLEKEGLGSLLPVGVNLALLITLGLSLFLAAFLVTIIKGKGGKRRGRK